MNHISGSSEGALDPSRHHSAIVDWDVKVTLNVKRSIKTLLSNTIPFYYSNSVLVHFICMCVLA